MLKTLNVNLEPHYPIHIGTDLLNNDLLFNFCRTQATTQVIITDDHLVSSYGEKLNTLLQQQGFKTLLLSFPHGEHNKTRETKQWLEDKMLAQCCGRDIAIIALGGGVVTDLAGFIAATYCRGVPAIYIPTTLLAMVDASIGGKTGVDTPYGKNLIGTFTQPKAVFSDVSLLASLSTREFNNGLVEIIKHALIADAAGFEQLFNNPTAIHDTALLQEIIYNSCDIKRQIVELDETEQGKRQLLNFGHTIGHALETASDYSMLHGEAVAIGIAVESYISYQLGILSNDDFEKILSIFTAYKIPVHVKPNFLNREAIKSNLSLDKKAKANLPYFVLLEGIGKPHVSRHGFSMPVEDGLIDEAIDWMLM